MLLSLSRHHRVRGVFVAVGVSEARMLRFVGCVQRIPLCDVYNYTLCSNHANFYKISSKALLQYQVFVMLPDPITEKTKKRLKETLRENTVVSRLIIVQNTLCYQLIHATFKGVMFQTPGFSNFYWNFFSDILSYFIFCILFWIVLLAPGYHILCKIFFLGYFYWVPKKQLPLRDGSGPLRLHGSLQI